ncbi:MAG: hypothetical protein C0487_18620 [Leptothrix sp. (in: Bacteria)]|nr:hypothetical protein [Leptothrix sp. (in: b-proteobacteria)]
MARLMALDDATSRGLFRPRLALVEGPARSEALQLQARSLLHVERYRVWRTLADQAECLVAT